VAVAATRGLAGVVEAPPTVVGFAFEAWPGASRARRAAFGPSAGTDPAGRWGGLDAGADFAGASWAEDGEARRWSGRPTAGAGGAGGTAFLVGDVDFARGGAPGEAVAGLARRTVRGLEAGAGATSGAGSVAARERCSDGGAPAVSGFAGDRRVPDRPLGVAYSAAIDLVFARGAAGAAAAACAV
jgi:hypothetical protein